MIYISYKNNFMFALKSRYPSCNFAQNILSLVGFEKGTLRGVILTGDLNTNII